MKIAKGKYYDFNRENQKDSLKFFNKSEAPWFPDQLKLGKPGVGPTIRSKIGVRSPKILPTLRQVLIGQVRKSIRRMPWHRKPMKDVTSCDKLR